MALMDSDTWYLPNETLQFRNYPELYGIMDDLDSLVTYTMRINDALDYYNSGTYDRIDVDVVDLQTNINLCRSLASTVGNASNVCFDLLVELREIQDILQTIMFAYRRFGSQYIGTPTELTAEADTTT